MTFGGFKGIFVSLGKLGKPLVRIHQYLISTFTNMKHEPRATLMAAECKNITIHPFILRLQVRGLQTDEFFKPWHHSQPFFVACYRYTAIDGKRNERQPSKTNKQTNKQTKQTNKQTNYTNKERPVRLAGVKGLLRVGGGGLFKGGGRGCLMGEGGFLGWPRSPSPPPSKEQRGEGDLLRGGGGFVVKGGGGGC